jgi:hypothetical protein
MHMQLLNIIYIYSNVASRATLDANRETAAEMEARITKRITQQVMKDLLSAGISTKSIEKNLSILTEEGLSQADQQSLSHTTQHDSDASD